MQIIMLKPILLVVYFLIGLRFAYSFMAYSINRHSTLGDMFNLLVAAVIMLLLWPLPVLGKLIKDS